MLETEHGIGTIEYLRPSHIMQTTFSLLDRNIGTERDTQPAHVKHKFNRKICLLFSFAKEGVGTKSITGIELK